jgi:hypothetical protein
VTDAGARLQHKADKPTHGDDRAYPSGIDEYEGAVDDVELALFQEQD